MEVIIFVEDGDYSFGVFAHGDGSLAQGVIRAVGLDLVDDLVELDGQVLGERACFLMGENNIQVFGFEQRSVGVMGAAGLNGKTLGGVFAELGQESIGGIDVRNVW